MNKRIALTTLTCLLLLGAGAHADEGKDESGKGKQRYEERFKRSERGERSERSDRDHRDGNSHFHRQGQTRIPNGHLPPPGECRVWYPNRPAGQQPPPFKCGKSPGRVEPGGWVFSPGPSRQEIEVSVYDERRPGIVIDVGIFDARTGSLLRVTGAR